MISELLPHLFIIAVAFCALLWSADRFVAGAAAIAKQAGVSPLIIGMTIVSFGTSAPEIVVSVVSAMRGAGEIAVGNALGSNIANTGLVLGATAMIAPLVVSRATVMTDVPILLGIILISGWLLSDGVLGFMDAAILLTGLLLFLVKLYRGSQQDTAVVDEVCLPEMSSKKAWLTFLLGLVILIASSRYLVISATEIAMTLGVSELIIGLTIVALGTSLPELAASALSAIKGHADIAIGAVVGSNIFNLLVVLSLPGLFTDLNIGKPEMMRDMGTVLVTTLILFVCLLLSWDKSNNSAGLGRGAGVILLASYVLYYVLLIKTQ